MRTPVGLGLVGLGSRGVALARALGEIPGADVRWITDQSPRAATGAGRLLPAARVACDLDAVLEDELVDAVVVATPLATRYGIARSALDAGKHVFMEAPLAMDGADADDLVRRAEAGRRQLGANHALLSHPGVRRLEALLAAGRLGDVYYLHADRLGPAEGGESVLWSAGAAAIGLVLHLVGDQPIEVVAQGGSYGAGPADVAFCHLRFATGVRAQLSISSLEPQESRRLTVVCSHGTAVLDELRPQQPLTLTDATADALISPRLDDWDPARSRCEEFLATVRSPGHSTQTGRAAAAVVAVVEALQRSLDCGGAAEPIGRLDAREEPQLADVVKLPVQFA